MTKENNALIYGLFVSKGKNMAKLNFKNQDRPFFVTKEDEAEMIATGYEFELPPIVCTLRRRDALEGMTDIELVKYRRCEWFEF